MDVSGLNGDISAAQRPSGSALLCRILEEGGAVEENEIVSCDCHMTTSAADSSSVENPFLVSMEFLDSDLLMKDHNGFHESIAQPVLAVPCRLQSVGEPSENESTAEERDTVPCDSPSTTDTGAMLEEDCVGKVTFTSQQEGHVTIASDRLGSGAHHYENWFVVEELARTKLLRGKRNKGFRTGVRQRAPQPLPRQSYLKMKFTRPSPIVRKRRSGGKPRPPLATSEGDMAQADEMGEEDRVSDDGFVDSAENVRRRKRRQTGMQVLLPAASPPSSPSHSPMYRKKSLSRKGRAKPRPRKPSKHTMAFADISTQETTTPGPGSSDTSNEGDNPLTEEMEQVSADGGTDMDKEQGQPGTQTHSHFPSPQHLPTKSAIPRPVPATGRVQSAGSQPNRRQGPSTLVTTPLPQPQGDDSQTSDVEPTSSALSLSSTRLILSRKLESDLSTAPLSSETSDMDTSGNERAKDVSNKPLPLVSHTSTVSTCMTKGGISQVPPTGRKTSPTGRVHVNKGTESGRLERPLLGKPSVSKKPSFVIPTGVGSTFANKQSAPLEVRQSSVVKLVTNSSASSPEGVQKRQQPAWSSSGRGPPVHSQSVPILRPKPAVPAKPQLPKPELKPKPFLPGQSKPPVSQTYNGKPCPLATSAEVEEVLAQPSMVTGRTTTERQSEMGRTNPNIGRFSHRPGKSESSGAVIKPPSILSQHSEPAILSKEDLAKERSVVSPGEWRSPLPKPLLRKPLSTPTISSVTLRSGASTPPPAPKTSISQPSSSRLRKPSPPTRLPSAVKKAESPLGNGSDVNKGSVYSTPVKPHPPAKPHTHREQILIPQKPLRTRKISPKAMPVPLTSSTISSAQSIQSLKSSPRRPPPQPPTSPPPQPPTSPPTSEPHSPISPQTHSSQNKRGSFSEGTSALAAPNHQAGEDNTDFVDSTTNNQPRNYEEYVPTLNRKKLPSAEFLAALAVGKESAESMSPKASTPGQEIVERSPLQRSLSSASTLGRRPSPTKPARPSPAGSAESGEDDPPPLPPRNYTLEDSLSSFPSNMSATLLDMAQEPRHTLRSHSISICPPPLPSQPIPRRRTVVGSSTPTGSPNLKRREPLQSVYSLAETPHSPSSPSDQEKTENLYEEINIGPYYVPRQWRKPGPCPPSLISPGIYQHYEMSDPFAYRPVPSYARVPSAIKNMDHDLVDRRFSASICVSNSSGLSPVTIRRANSDKTASRIPKVLISMSMTDDEKRRSMQRTPSLDYLDDRMNQTSWNALTDPGYSSGEEENTGVVSPTQGLPQPPKSTFVLPPSGSKGENPDDEPLYQYLNHTEFGGTPIIPRTHSASSTSSNQLELARQLSINHRKLWCEQPEVVQSGVLRTISDQDRKLQEAMFEVITSEASYLRSINVLIEQFMDNPGMNPNLPIGRRVLDKRQHHVIFSNVREIRDVSAKFLRELQQRQRQTTLNMSICDIVLKYAEDEFGCYIPYCTNQVYQMRELRELIDSSVMFREYLKRLESHRRCQSLNIQSFLLLPVQRITRMPLLILAVLNRTPLDHPNHGIVERTLRTFQNIVTACNNGARQMERTEELHSVYQKLDFGKMKPFPLVSVMRQLERKGSLIHLQVEQRLFGKPRIKQTPMYLLVFTDYVIVAKKKKSSKGDIFYKVVDYASRAVIEVEKLKTKTRMMFPKHVFGEQETIARATWAVSTATSEHAFLLMLLENAYQKLEKYIFICQNDTDRTRWMEALAHPRKEKEKDDEKIYERWDCPQVQAIYDYEAQQPDELGLMRGDVVKVFRKMADGWHEGERMRDLQWGWFPSNFTVEVENEHTKARNLRERHRLLSLPFNPKNFAQEINAIR